MYFVAECTTRSAPSVERLLEQGSGEGVVDDDVGTGLVGGLGDRGMSATSSAGLVGDSSQTSEASSHAATTARCR
jgi:hypothetical protein